MVRHTELIGNLGRHTDLNAKNNGIKLTTAIIGIFTYNILVIPILSLIVAGALKVNGDYVIPIAIAWVFVGIYVTENYACRNFQ
jgi:hypothetical protein